MNDPQDSAIEPVESEPPESADSDLSDEALDRPPGGGNTLSPVLIIVGLSLDRPAGQVRSLESRGGRLGKV